MKVLYLFLDGTRSPGVIRKVKSKIHFLNELGMETTGIFMNRTIEKREYNPEEKIVYVPLQIETLPMIYNRRFIRNFRPKFAFRSYTKQFYQQLEAEVSRHEFDLILFRYPLANKELLRFVKKYSGKVVFEHNSKELVELALDLPAKPGIRFHLEAEQEYGPLVLSQAKGITGVGKEITAYEVKRSGRTTIPNAVIANGIDVGPLKVRQSPGMPLNELRMLFVSGSPSPWVGIDTLLNGLNQYKGSLPLKLFIVGPKTDELLQLVSDAKLDSIVTLTGELRGADLEKYMNESHIAFGTLAMQRVELNEHSSLKVLEYASCGIPFVISYEDTNFSPGGDFAPYFLQLPYNGKEINLEKVVQFAKQVLADPEHPQKMRALAEKKLDFRLKMNLLKEFLEKTAHVQ